MKDVVLGNCDIEKQIKPKVAIVGSYSNTKKIMGEMIKNLQGQKENTVTLRPCQKEKIDELEAKRLSKLKDHLECGAFDGDVISEVKIGRKNYGKKINKKNLRNAR